MIELGNVPIITIKDYKVKGGTVPAKAVKNVPGSEFAALPVVIKLGAVNMKIGMVHRVRIGRNQIFGDLVLSIDGELEFEPVVDGDGNITSIKPIRYVYKRE